MKARRQSVILDVIQRAAGAQPGAAAPPACARAGFDVTQATLSRDIRELGLVKGGADGAYQAPPAPRRNGQHAAAVLQRALGDDLTRVDRVQQLVLLRTGPGRRSCSASRSMARGFRTWSARSPATTRFWSSRRMSRRARALVKRLEEMSNA